MVRVASLRRLDVRQLSGRRLVALVTPQPMLSTRPGNSLPGLSSSATGTGPGLHVTELVFAHVR